MRNGVRRMDTFVHVLQHGVDDSHLMKSSLYQMPVAESRPA